MSPLVLDYEHSFWKSSEQALPFHTGPGPTVYTCCRCLSPFSFAGLLSDPLLLPDCSFSFSKAVAYANVSCGRWKHEKRRLGAA